MDDDAARSDDGANDDSSDDSDPQEAETKKWQRIAEKARGQVRDLTRQVVEASQAKAAATRMEEAFYSYLEQQGDEEAAGKARSRRDAESKAYEYQGQLIEALQEHDVDLNDESMAEVRKLWGEGKHAEAVAAAKTTLGTKTGADDIEKIVSQRVTEALRQAGLRVDTAGASAPSASKQLKRSEFAALTDPAMAKDPRALIAKRDELLSRFYKKR